ncbi:MAG: hypothetical protein HC815_04080 [Richelia sp. RM1_1_1]|nr:hypothetical protein [Richelia sp. RM1_1_1]
MNQQITINVSADFLEDAMLDLIGLLEDRFYSEQEEADMLGYPLSPDDFKSWLKDCYPELVKHPEFMAYLTN